MAEAKWQFTSMQWNAYIAQTPASDIQKVQQLWAACDKDLLQRVYDCETFSSRPYIQKYHLKEVDSPGYSNFTVSTLLKRHQLTYYLKVEPYYLLLRVTSLMFHRTI